MKDQISATRVKALHPAIREKAENFINDSESLLGVVLRVIQGGRTFEEQDEIYAQGRTKPGKIVTKARGGQSMHCYFLAFDIAELKDEKINWNFDYAKLKPIADKYDLEWGGMWKFVDKPHYQLKGLPHWSELLKRYDKKDFIKFTKYVRL